MTKSYSMFLSPNAGFIKGIVIIVYIVYSNQRVIVKHVKDTVCTLVLRPGHRPLGRDCLNWHSKGFYMFLAIN